MVPPDQFCFDGFEERLDRGAVITITLAGHRHLKLMLPQDFLVIMRAVLGGFNRSSQHPICEGVDDNWKTEIRALDAA